MSTTANRLALLSRTKADIKAALIEQGREPSDIFSSYGDEIRAIVADGDSGDTGDLDALIDGSLARISSNAESVRAYAFYMNDSLIEADFPQAISIGASAFCVEPYYNEEDEAAGNKFSSLTVVNFPKTSNIKTCAFKQCAALTEANFPSVISLGSYAFTECTAMTSARFAIAESIGDGAFQNCESLVDIDFPLVTNIGNYVFPFCTALTSADFPLAEIVGYGSFQYCTNLAHANFPAATTVEAFSFEGCTNLTNADFPLATSVAYGTFQQCTKLVSVNFPSATEVNSNAFGNCTALSILDFPLVKIIVSSAFYNCSNLTALILRSTSVCSLVSTNAFTNSAIDKGTGYIYVPSALVANYKAATNWATYANQIRAIEDYPAITGG